MFPEEWTDRQALSREIVYLTTILVLARMAYLTVPFIQGLVLVSALGACAAIIVLLGPVGPRKLCAVLIVLAIILVWALYYFAIVLNWDLQDPRLTGGMRMKLAAVLLGSVVAFIIYKAMGITLGFGTTDSTKSDREIRVFQDNDLRLAIGAFTWRKGRN